MKDVKWWHGLLIEEPSLHMAEGGGIDPISNLCVVSHLCPPEVSQIPVRDISENWFGFVECQVFLTTEGETWLWLASERVKKPFTVDTAHSNILRNLWKYPNDERVSKKENDWARSYVVACLDRTFAVTWKHSRSAWQFSAISSRQSSGSAEKCISQRQPEHGSSKSLSAQAGQKTSFVRLRQGFTHSLTFSVFCFFL